MFKTEENIFQFLNGGKHEDIRIAETKRNNNKL